MSMHKNPKKPLNVAILPPVMIVNKSSGTPLASKSIVNQDSSNKSTDSSVKEESKLPTPSSRRGAVPPRPQSSKRSHENKIPIVLS